MTSGGFLFLRKRHLPGAATSIANYHLWLIAQSCPGENDSRLRRLVVLVLVLELEARREVVEWAVAETETGGTQNGLRDVLFGDWNRLAQ
jgi:hypothetical protein